MPSTLALTRALRNVRNILRCPRRLPALLCLWMVFCCISLATSPLPMSQWIDCIQDNVGRYDTDCLLDPSGDPYTISSTIYFWRRNITIDGAWPWPELLRAVGFTGDLMKSGHPSTDSYPTWVTIQNIYFHGNRWNGATSSGFELNLLGCSYCTV